MKLIREISEAVATQETIEESGEKSFFIEGIFMQSEVKNRNGRIYPKSILESELNKYENKIKSKRALGELDHPNGPKINPDRVSHYMTELSFRGNDIIGKAKIMDTPCGKIVKEFMKEGLSFGVSSRGVGSVKNGLVQNDFRLSTVDIVTDPSGPDCFVNGIMENVEWIYDERNGWKAQEIAEDIQKHVSKGNNLTESQKLKAFQMFLNSL